MATAVLTNTGKAHVTDVVDPATRSAQSTTYDLGWGHDGTAAATTDTTLGAESADEARVETTVSQPSSNVVQFVAEQEADVDHLDTPVNGGPIREAAIFTGGGDMVLRGTHAAVNVMAGDRIEYTFTLTFLDQSEA